MPAIYEHKLIVPPEAIDAQGHAGNLEYLRWTLKAAVAHSTAQGWPPERYQAASAGWVVRSHCIDYLSPAFAGDEVTVFTWVADFRKIRSLRKYKIVRTTDDVLLSRAETEWAYIGLEHRVPRRIPPELSSAFEIIADVP
jgi:acyl-CoA thioester hydrolase